MLGLCRPPKTCRLGDFKRLLQKDFIAMGGAREGADQGLVRGSRSQHIESVPTCWERSGRAVDPELLDAEVEGGGSEPEQLGGPETMNPRGSGGAANGRYVSGASKPKRIHFDVRR